MTKQMRKAVNELHVLAIDSNRGTGCASPEQILQVAEKYEFECWKLESEYLDDADRLADE